MELIKKYVLGCVVLLLLSFSVPAQDQEAIKQVIQTAYVDGLMNEGDSMKIDQGFHPTFVMIGVNEKDDLWSLPISKWRSQKIAFRAEGKLPRSENDLVTVKYHSIDITGKTAVAKLDYMEGGMVTYVDYISLYKVKNKWKIIGKIFHKVE